MKKGKRPTNSLCPCPAQQAPVEATKPLDKNAAMDFVATLFGVFVAKVIMKFIEIETTLKK
jgi:hypothetical protein